jgi:hypothetical protein
VACWPATTQERQREPQCSRCPPERTPAKMSRHAKLICEGFAHVLFFWAVSRHDFLG